MSRPIARRAALGGGGGLLLSAAGWGLGCDSGSTTGRRVAYALEVTSDLADAGALETSLGWRVTLDQALMGLGRVLFVEGAPVARGWRELLVPQAHAHPGHYAEGEVLAELLTPTMIDLTAPTDVAVLEGTAGSMRSAVLGFHDPAEGELDPAMGESVVRLMGTATRDDVEVSFSADATVGEVTNRAPASPTSKAVPSARASRGEARCACRSRSVFGSTGSPSTSSAPKTSLHSCAARRLTTPSCAAYARPSPTPPSTYPSEPMTNFRYPTAIAASLFLFGCSSGGGDVRVEAWGEEYIEQEIPPKSSRMVGR